MAQLVDTSILARLANTSDTLHTTATQAGLELHCRSEILCITSQVLIEFRSVATRPIALNGLGLSQADTEAKATAFEALFQLLSETPDIYPVWKALVKTLGIIGKQVHDARLVAVCHVHGVTHVFTFNTTHFARLAGFGSGIVIVVPASI